MKALIVYNPFSGKHKFVSKIDYVRRMLLTKYDDVYIYRSISQGSICKTIEEIGEEYDLIVVSGGDGTLNEAINGIMKLKTRPSLSYIPYGTVNDVGHMLKLKSNIKKCIKTILYGAKVSMDIVQIDNKYFIYAAAVGKFTNVSYEASNSLKKHFGRMAYFLESVKSITKDEKMNLVIETDSGQISGSFYVIIALNSKFIAGFNLHRRLKPKLNDGVIDLSIIENSRIHRNILNLGGFFLFGDLWPFKVKTIQCKRIKITSPIDLSYNVDGEFACRKKEVEITVIPQAINLMVSNKVKNKYFI